MVEFTVYSLTFVVWCLTKDNEAETQSSCLWTRGLI